MEHQRLNILLLEDEDVWASTVHEVVEALDWTIARHISVDAATRAVLKTNFHIVIIDRLLGDSEDGISLINALKRHEATTMILVVSQLATIDETVAGLEAGADDYLAKPFDKTELRARLVALARRRGHWTHYPTVEVVGDLEIREAAKTVCYNGASIRMPEQLFKLLCLFAENRGVILSKETLWYEVWPQLSRLPPQHNTIEKSVGRLKSLLKALTGKSFIKSVRGQGYRFDDF